jgi:hypothetical protein
VPTLIVRLHGGLERKTGAPAYVLRGLPSGAKLLDVQDALGIPHGDVGLFVVEGELRHEAFAPPAGAHIDIYPLFGGG